MLFSVYDQANSRQLFRGKVPVVCAVIESVTARGVDAGVTLRDPTGYNLHRFMTTNLS